MEVSKEGKVGNVVRGSESYQSKQGSVYAPGISAETVGAKVLFLGIVTLPPEGRTKSHIHEHHESAFYMLSGDEVELWTGDQLEHKEVAHAGDYLFIPAKVPHVAVNRGKTPAVFVGVRNEPTAQESVVMLPELDALVP
jgi:uncharacterized RmlC-like cupin family protein